METCDSCGDGLIVLVQMGDEPLFECDLCGCEYEMAGTELQKASE